MILTPETPKVHLRLLSHHHALVLYSSTLRWGATSLAQSESRRICFCLVVIYSATAIAVSAALTHRYLANTGLAGYLSNAVLKGGGLSRRALLCRWWIRVFLQVCSRGTPAAGLRSTAGKQRCAAAQAAAPAGLSAEAGGPWRG